jgi:hypothetical protein
MHLSMRVLFWYLLLILPFTSPLLKIYCTAFTAQKQPVRPLPLPHIHLCSIRTQGKESCR